MRFRQSKDRARPTLPLGPSGRVAEPLPLRLTAPQPDHRDSESRRPIRFIKCLDHRGFNRLQQNEQAPDDVGLRGIRFGVA